MWDNNFKVIPNAISIDLELLTVEEMKMILSKNHGYVDGDKRKLIVWCKK